MATHTRLTVGFSEAQIRWLTQEATQRGVTLSEILRRLVDEVRGDRILSHQNERR